MLVTGEKTGDTLVCKLSGRLDAENAEYLHDQLTAMLEDGCQVLLGDLAELSYISSAGLRVFLARAKEMARRGGRMGLFALQPVVREVFDISGFYKIVPVYGTREEALNDLCQ